jgi:hypothetical protein
MWEKIKTIAKWQKFHPVFSVWVVDDHRAIVAL